jgi:hypothetical protein
MSGKLAASAQCRGPNTRGIFVWGLSLFSDLRSSLDPVNPGALMLSDGQGDSDF